MMLKMLTDLGMRTTIAEKGPGKTSTTLMEEIDPNTAKRMTTEEKGLGKTMTTVIEKTSPRIMARAAAKSLVEKTKKTQQTFQQNPHLHGADDPTWLKLGGRDKIVAGVMFSACIINLLQISSGVYKMSYGIGQE